MTDLRSISLIICTHNRREILSQTLESVRQMQVPAGVEVELLVVANACSDGTEQMVSEAAPTMPFPTRVVTEPRANLAIARNCGMKNTAAPLVAMLDDDVWLEKYWLEGMLEVFREKEAGIVVGKVTAWWHDTPRPDWMRPSFEGLLSIGDFGEQIIEIEPGSALGCNYMFSRKLWEEIGGFAEGLGRTGKQLLGGEDVQFSQQAVKRGYHIYYAPRGTLRHYIAPFKANEKYLTGVAYGNAKSKIFARDPFGPAQICRAFLGHAYLFVCNGLLGLFSADKGKKIERRVLRNIGAGGMVGVGRRIMGLDLK